MTRSFTSIWEFRMELTAILYAIPWDKILIQTVNGIVTGMILALIASGLTLIFVIMDVVNFAHGELFMLDAYIGVVVLATTGNFWLALLIRSEEHTSELQSLRHLVCRLLLEKEQ